MFDTFLFRPLELDDMPILLEWLQRPHVRQWWGGGDDSLEKVREHYTRDFDTTKRFILIEATSATPLGYFQYYLKPNGVIGIDQFLASAENLNKGLGVIVISKFIEMVCQKHSPRQIIADPHPNNSRAIRCYEKVGFSQSVIVNDEFQKPSCLMTFCPRK